MDELALNLEQRFMVQRLAFEGRQMSQAELIEALCSSWVARFQMKNVIHAFCRQHGIGFRIEECSGSIGLLDEEDLAELLGYEPTEEEIEAYLEGLHEAATMELDMDAIVLSPDEGDI